MKYALMLALLTTLTTACTSMHDGGMHGSGDMMMDKPMSGGTAMDMEKKKKDEAPMSGSGM